MSAGDLVVITSCTARKVETRMNGGRPVPTTAESLYAGQQHVRLMRGIRAYRGAGRPAGALKLKILSAYYGLLSATTPVESYDHTLHGLPREVIRAQADDLRVPSKIRSLLSRPYALGLLLLGDEYLRACDLSSDLTLGGPTIAFCSPSVARRMSALDGLRCIPVDNRQAKRFSCGLIALKGEFGGRALASLSQSPQKLGELQDPRVDVLDWLEAIPPTTARLVAAVR